MGFIGSISQPLRKFFATHASLIEGRRVYVGCSGNFTIESVMSSQLKSVEVFSNDVSLYSSVIGCMLTDRHLDLRVTSEELEWVNRYMEQGPEEKVAAIQLLLAMLEFGKRNNDFRRRMWRTYVSQFDTMFDKTLVKVRKFKEGVRIKEYTTEDVYDFFPRTDGVAIGFLPTYVGGYEKLFKALDEVTAWDEPSYQVLTAERRDATIEKMTQGDYILYDDVPRSLPCVAKVEKPGKRSVYIYSNLDFPVALVKPTPSEKAPKYDILMPDDEIPDDAAITVRPVDLPTINHYRSLYLSKRIVPGAGGLPCLVFADDKLIGAMMFQTYSLKLKSPTEVYLMTDFVVPSRKHRRLAKLMLMVILCRDTRERLERSEIKRYETVLTSVFTDKPVSMKYRGLFKLAKRGENFLNYRGTFNDMTYQEVVKAWKKRFEKS